MKKFLAAILSALILTAAMATALASEYIGNANSGKFHYADCRTVAKMNPANKVFFNTRADAVAAGYVPCKVCAP